MFSFIDGLAYETIRPCRDRSSHGDDAVQVYKCTSVPFALLMKGIGFSETLFLPAEIPSIGSHMAAILTL